MTSSKLFSESIMSSSSQRLKGRKAQRVGEGRKSQFIRTTVLRLLVMALFLLLTAGLVRAQIYEGAYYKDLADGNRARQLLFPAESPWNLKYRRLFVPVYF